MQCMSFYFVSILALLLCETKSKKQIEHLSSSKSSVVFALDSNANKETWINIKSSFSLETEVIRLDRLHNTDSVINIIGQISFSLGEIGNTAYSFEYYASPGDTVNIYYDRNGIALININSITTKSQVLQNLYYNIKKNTIGINSLIEQEVSNLITREPIVLPPPEKAASNNVLFIDTLFLKGFIDENTRTLLALRQYGFLCSYYIFKNNTSAFKSIFEQKLLPHNYFIESSIYYKELFITYAKLIANVKLDKEEIDYKKLAFSDYSQFGNTLRDYLLFYSLTKARVFQPTDFNEIEKYFLNTCTDSLLKKHYIQSEIPKSNISNPKSDIVFDTKSTSIQLSALLEKFRGKVIYIDFWASWCAPCIAEMPDGKKLRDKYRNKNIVFIFISIDNSFKAWLNSQHRLLIDNNEPSLLLAETKKSKIINSLKLSSIPRYLIYNKKGVLVNSNAPSPSEIKKTEILDRLINE